MAGNRITSEYIHQCLNEFNEARQNAGKNESGGILEAALFIEDMFGLVLTDDEICTENFRNGKNLEEFVLRKHGF